MFDWTEESKEKYWKIAQERINDAGLSEIVYIDRLRFSTMKENVKVHIQPIKTKGNFRVWARIKRIKGFEENQANKKGLARSQKNMFYHGCFVMPMTIREEMQ